MAELKRGDSRLTYQDSGVGSPSFLFLRSASAPDTLWSAQVANLVGQHRCLVAEVSGESAQVDAVSELLAELKPGPVIVVAHEAACAAALLFNEHYPEAVMGIALVNPALPPAGDATDVSHAESLVHLADKKPFMIIWPENPAGNPSWLREVAMFVRQEPVAGALSTPQVEQPDITNALLRAFLDDVRDDPRLI